MTEEKKRSSVFIILRIGLLAYVGLLLVMAGCQRHFIYYPARAGEGVLLTQAAEVGLKEWRDGAGELIGWKAPAPHEEQVSRRAVVFQGNAGMAAHRDFYASGIQATSKGDDWEVYLFEYPGYGSRDGSPSERSIYEAAREALRLLFAEEGKAVYLIGESLGSGVACRMAAEFADEVSGVLLVTPFTSLADVGKRHFPLLPVRLLLRERYDNLAALETYRGPVAILLAEHDEVVPADLGQRLYDLYDGPKKLWIQEGQRHNTLDVSRHHPFWEEMTAFLVESGEE